MMYKDVIFGATSSDLVPINEIELSARLGTTFSLNDDMVVNYKKIYNDNVAYRYAYVKVPFKIEDGTCCFENIELNSHSLCKVLRESNEVILIAVTAGISIDKLIAKNEIMNPSAAFYLDAIASASIESYMDYISKEICHSLNVTNRFSPGYADFPLEFQKYLLDRLSAKESIGIMLSSECLMIPMKSITAVIGIKNI